jgi:hypothetical protein
MERPDPSIKMTCKVIKTKEIPRRWLSFKQIQCVSYEGVVKDMHEQQGTFSWADSILPVLANQNIQLHPLAVNRICCIGHPGQLHGTAFSLSFRKVISIQRSNCWDLIALCDHLIPLLN